MDNSPRKTLRACRICSTKVKLELLFLHRPRDVVQMITGFANITIEKTDELPQHICKKCIRKVNECHDFKVQCEGADKKFRDALKEPPEPENDEPLKVVQTKAKSETVKVEEKPRISQFQEITVDCDPNTLFEPECVEVPEDIHVKSSISDDSDDDDDRVDLISQKVDSKIKEESNSQEAKEVDYDSSETDEFQYERSDGEQEDNENIEEDVKNENNSTNDTENQQADGCSDRNEAQPLAKKQRKRKKPLSVAGHKEMVQCKLCLKYYSSDVIRQHKPKHTENDPACPVCKIYETSDRTLRRHIKAVHNLDPWTMRPINPMECKDCFQIFYNYREFTKHQKTHRKKFECSTCHLTFDQIVFLKHHEKKHVGQAEGGGYACDICSMVFAQRVHLRRHLVQIHSNEKPFVCEVCSKAYATKYGLSRHALIHMEKSHVCHICGKAYNSNKNLNVHIKTHEKEPKARRTNSLCRMTTAKRKYIYYQKCSVCDRIVSHAYLKVHMMSHTGERPFKCVQCGKGFFTAKILRDHMRTHSDEKPHKCAECDSSFRLYRELKAHKRAHCDVQYHYCRYCDKPFAHKGNCVAHERSHTGEKPYVCEVCGEKYSNSNVLKRHKRGVHNIMT